MITQKGDQWCLMTSDGSRVLGCHDSKEGAMAQERAVQAAKHMAQDELYDIKDIEIFATGKWNNESYNEADLDEIVNAHKEIGYIPPLKKDHSKGGEAQGWIQNIRRAGNKLLADFTSIGKDTYEAIKSKKWNAVSPEIYWNLERNGKKFKRALKAVALLGAEIPAVDLKPLHEAKFSFESLHHYEIKVDELNEKHYKKHSAAWDRCVEKVGEKGGVNPYAVCTWSLSKTDNVYESEDKTKAKEYNLGQEVVIGLEEMKKMMSDGSMPGMDGMDGETKAKMSDHSWIDKLMANGVTKIKVMPDYSIEMMEEKHMPDDDKNKGNGNTTVLNLDEDLKNVWSAEVKDEKEKLIKLRQESRQELIKQKINGLKIPAFKPFFKMIYDLASCSCHAATLNKDGKEQVKLYQVMANGEAKQVTADQAVDLFMEIMNKSAENLFRDITKQDIRRFEQAVENFDDPSKEVNSRVTKYIAEHKDVTYAQGMKIVLDADPALKNRYAEVEAK